MQIGDNWWESFGLVKIDLSNNAIPDLPEEMAEHNAVSINLTGLGSPTLEFSIQPNRKLTKEHFLVKQPQISGFVIQ